MSNAGENAQADSSKVSILALSEEGATGWPGYLTLGLCREQKQSARVGINLHQTAFSK
jgi:hypothetical protein